MSLPPFIGFFRELIIFSSYLFGSIYNFIFIILVIIITRYYRLILYLYPSTSLESKIELSEELFVRENLIIYIHGFFLFVSILFF